MIIRQESKQLISTTQIKEKFDLYTYLSEADRVRICFEILSRFKFKDCKNFQAKLDEKEFKRIDDNEYLIDFLKRVDIVTDILCLNSRSRAVNRLNNFKGGEKDNKKNDGLIWRKASKHYFIDDFVVREYYGEEVALYFTWMNYFLKWILVPAMVAAVFRTLNCFFYEDLSKSPLNALFAIGMAFWGSLFAANWKRNEHSLKIIWNNETKDHD